MTGGTTGPVPAGGEAPVLVLRDLAFAYPGGPRVVDGVDLEVRPGELFGIIGPNGSGKSTLTALACGLAQPAAGQALLLGRPVSAWPRRELARRVALVPQDTGAPFPFTVLEMVLMGRYPHLGPMAIEGRADLETAEAAMRVTGIAELRARSLDQLSGGERQRALIARALAQTPRLLVCDEPTSHLDIHHAVEICDLLWRRTRDEGLAVVLVLHDLNLAAAYCDRLLLLDAGRPVAVGPVDEVLTYRHVKDVYRTEVWVGVNDLTGARFLVPVAGHRRDRPGG